MMMSSKAAVPEPDVKSGIDYWASQPASYDGVLGKHRVSMPLYDLTDETGGFGTGSLPRIDALGSREFLLYLMPQLCTVPSAIRPLDAPKELPNRIRALEVGAGIGRVTGDVLLHLVSDVVLVEPVDTLVNEALARGKASEIGAPKGDKTFVRWKGIKEKTKSVTIIQNTLQDIDPCNVSKSTKILGRIGYERTAEGTDLDSPFDVVWCQWCLGSLSDTDLVEFLKRSRAALRDASSSVIIVKENCCSDAEGGGPATEFDETDSSLTRSDQAWKKVFKDAGLRLIRERVQGGFPPGLYVVKMYALR
ncbi:DUF858-domain-containing protein [Laetiporus sulphureus 93-53]|uniref:Alpha N-terminal protein methyltransferase 1 n=1 Tax=Laetiporus sulphureus 93-53 TaxID=1314785 RepID=A0A165FWD1_9APHY|nr:DUF858-domain-containing protein [Laetiporus sulphureus 93-53]KZT09498.1 DUF858-domain-containing protein [Laetiporus sulphureus 93-53]